MSDYTTQIAKGVALLDEKVPGWLDRIDLERLDMVKCRIYDGGCGCVLAQLGPGGDADNITGELGLGRWPQGIISRASKDHGFDGADYQALTAEWKATILRLRSKQP